MITSGRQIALIGWLTTTLAGGTACAAPKLGAALMDRATNVQSGGAAIAAEQPAPALVPYGARQPPKDVTPAQTRGSIPWGPKELNLPKPTWTPEQRRAYESRLQWFHQAKYGLFFHFLAFGDRSQEKGRGDSEGNWTSERWNRIVDEVDVEAAAEQAKELGAGYVFISLGQNHKYACGPNPVIDALWGFQPAQYNARRDLPMELGRALAKRGIALMLYIASDNQHKLPQPDGWTDSVRFENWTKVAQWYSDHYGTLCKGWWVDGMRNAVAILGDKKWKQNYPERFVLALRHGNPAAIVSCEVNELADYIHGHCNRVDWDRQRTIVKPFFGRWDPEFNIQWHVLQCIGTRWADADTPKQTADLVAYAVDVVRGGGVFTFDVGTRKTVDGKTVPKLDVPPEQMAQLRAVRDALKSIPPAGASVLK